MDIVLLSEVIKEQDLWAYPYNALRNQALARADTDVSNPPLIRSRMTAGYLSDATYPASQRNLRNQQQPIVINTADSCAGAAAAGRRLHCQRWTA